MRASICVVYIALVSLILSGCAYADGGTYGDCTKTLGGRESAAQVEVFGIGGETAPKSGQYGFAALEDVVVDGSKLKKSTKVGEVIEAENGKLIGVDIDDRSFDFKVLMQSYDGEGDIDAVVAEAEEDGTERPVFEMEDVGWIYAWGYWPFLRARWVSAAAEGTTIAIETYESMKMRVYVLKDSGGGIKTLTLRCRIDPAKFKKLNFDTNAADWFVEIGSEHLNDNCANWSTLEKKKVDESTAAKLFRNRAESAAKAAGWKK